MRTTLGHDAKVWANDFALEQEQRKAGKIKKSCCFTLPSTQIDSKQGYTIFQLQC